MSLQALSHRARYPRKAGGFALIEILIALAFVGGTLVALMLRMQTIANTSEFIESRTVAHWIAENRMQALVADQALGGNAVRTRREQDSLEYDNRQWFWRTEITELDLGALLASQTMYRVVVEVGLEEDQTLASITGYLGQ